MSEKERNTARAARETLEGLGFPLVQEDVPLGINAGWRADLIAWGSSPNGELVPRVLVEIKTSRRYSQTSVLSQLARVASAVGLVDCYLFDGHEWFMADERFTELLRVPGPSGPDASRTVVLKSEDASPGASMVPLRLSDPALLERLLGRRLWSLMDGWRSRGLGSLPIGALAEYVESLLQDSAVLMVGEGDRALPVRVDRRTLFEVVLRQVINVLSPRRLGTVEVGSDGRLVETMVRLAYIRPGWAVIDPFCGIGTVLWQIEQWSRDQGVPVELAGIEINDDVARLCAALAALSGERTAVLHADSLQRLTHDAADCIVTQPPFNRSLPGAQELWDSTTREWEPLALTRCIDALRPGGRAVVHTVRSWLWREKDARFRATLAGRVRIIALLGLPDGLITGSSISSALVVIEKSPPTETLVADLRDDWYEQLSPGGSCWERYVKLVRRD